MMLLLSIALGFLGVAAVVLLQSVLGDVVGLVLVMIALVAIIRSVIRLAGEAGAPPGEPVSPRSGSSREATSHRH
jgi:energy-converting hydrogenase Eha subunit C